MKKWLIISGIIMLFSLAMLTILCAFVYRNSGYPLDIDIWARDLAHNIRGEKFGFLYWSNRILTEFGYIYIVVAIGVLVLLYTKLDYRCFLLIIGLIVQVLLNQAFKACYQRTRPDFELWWAYERSSSFPSGHSATTGFLYPYLIFLAIFTIDNKKIKLATIISSAFFIVIVPISRIILGVHYFTDCLAGLSLGLLVSGLFMILTILFKEYKILPEGILPIFKKKKYNQN
jgi:undecaprenyl-diphosphatase